MKQTIRLNEEDFRKIVEECTKQIIKEEIDENVGWDIVKGALSGIRKANQNNRDDKRAINGGHSSKGF